MNYKKTFIIIFILVVTAIVTAFATDSEQVPPSLPFNEFPLTIGPWQGQATQMDEQVYNILGVEDYIMANFHKPSGELINFYVGYYQSQRNGDIIHSPKNCMPGAGWNITKTNVIPIELDVSENKKTNVIQLLLSKGGQKMVVLYWFQSRGRIIASEYMQKIWLVVDSISKRRTDGSFVRLIAPITKDEKTTVDLLEDFANQVYPILNKHIPS